MLGFYITVAASDHNRLVITTPLFAIGTKGIFFKAAKVTTKIGAAKLIIKGGAANGAFQHNIEGRHNATGLAVVGFPRLLVTGHPQIGHAKAREPDLGLGAPPYRTLITNFATRTGTRTRKG